MYIIIILILKCKNLRTDVCLLFFYAKTTGLTHMILFILAVLSCEIISKRGRSHSEKLEIYKLPKIWLRISYWLNRISLQNQPYNNHHNTDTNHRRSMWRSVVSAYPRGEKAWVYVCIMDIHKVTISLIPHNQERVHNFRHIYGHVVQYCSHTSAPIAHTFERFNRGNKWQMDWIVALQRLHPHVASKRGLRY